MELQTSDPPTGEMKGYEKGLVEERKEGVLFRSFIHTKLK